MPGSVDPECGPLVVVVVQVAEEGWRKDASDGLETLLVAQGFAVDLLRAQGGE